MSSFQAGLDAYERGDYDTAMTEWRPLAEQGHVGAQSLIGSMYDQGKGVPQDYQEAVRWYQKAAEQGHAWAQVNLGLMYARGQGLAQDYVQAYRWYTLAASQDDGLAGKSKAHLEKSMTLDQLAEAQRLAREWTPKGK